MPPESARRNSSSPAQPALQNVHALHSGCLHTGFCKTKPNERVSAAAAQTEGNHDCSFKSRKQRIVVKALTRTACCLGKPSGSSTWLPGAMNCKYAGAPNCLCSWSQTQALIFLQVAHCQSVSVCNNTFLPKQTALKLL